MLLVHFFTGLQQWKYQTNTWCLLLWAKPSIAKYAKLLRSNSLFYNLKKKTTCFLYFSFEIGAAPKADEEDFSYIDCDDVTDDISTTEQSSAMSQVSVKSIFAFFWLKNGVLMTVFSRMRHSWASVNGVNL